ncbi:MgtC/SapB family protein [Megasphaera paucivorans]|uniref:Putative Mg2+ transporter-C (MgtC) family protein n=1 Tax=Megasphaera paucivorans TaxID=349095 RepID=A0A1G9R8D2_9FIRM|nr:MgtC/SapB family protein [Megasphaera paucivorans]SDM18685.1 putative Mg2+ transporter-C (MgtC) family protein [Megasphaera paucivorans]
MITTIASIVRLCIAVILGGIIGYERQAQSKSAGLRTHILVCLGSCLCMIISINIAMDMYFQYGITNSDPERIAAQVITGIGFLGAGTILANQKERNVKGLTTAASIWAVAAVGLVVGAGYIVTAVAATFLVFIVLTIFIRVDDLVRRHRERQYTFHIIMRNTVGQSRRLADFFKKEDIQVESFQSIAAEEQPRAELIVSVSTFRDVHENKIILDLLALKGIEEVYTKPSDGKEKDM